MIENILSFILPFAVGFCFGRLGFKQYFETGTMPWEAIVGMLAFIGYIIVN